MNGVSEFFLNDVCDALDTYRGRDKLIRTLCYTSKLIGSLACDDNFAKKCRIFGSHMSTARIVTGLFNDLPALKNTLNYGVGDKEPDSFLATISFIINVVDQLYFFVDKIAWFAEINIITVKSTAAWRTSSTVLCGISIYLNLVRTLRQSIALHHHKDTIRNEETRQSALMKIADHHMELLSLVRLSLDLTQTINSLPSGFLWSSKLRQSQIGLIATISSFVGLYQMFAK
ncbi:hypothetical protein FQA39_LY13259 [Lamprigera yunnana]|nr:hypothetical protein FQA39_LY13259 [Lamprigera yunnana]